MRIASHTAIHHPQYHFRCYGHISKEAMNFIVAVLFASPAEEKRVVGVAGPMICVAPVENVSPATPVVEFCPF